MINFVTSQVFLVTMFTNYILALDNMSIVLVICDLLLAAIMWTSHTQTAQNLTYNSIGLNKVIRGEKLSLAMTTFFNWVQTSVRLCVSGSQKFLGKIGLILKVRDVKICCHFFVIV